MSFKQTTWVFCGRSVGTKLKIRDHFLSKEDVLTYRIGMAFQMPYWLYRKNNSAPVVHILFVKKIFLDLLQQPMFRAVGMVFYHSLEVKNFENSACTFLSPIFLSSQRG